MGFMYAGWSPYNYALNNPIFIIDPDGNIHDPRLGRWLACDPLAAKYPDWSPYHFGANNYDPRLGRWLACDPLAAKYPDWSPYHFGANNPILVVDKDGKDWTITTTDDGKGNRTVELKLTVALLNSAAPIDMEAFKQAAVDQLSYSYTFGSSGDNKSYNVSIQVEARVIGSKADLNADEHLIEILPSADPTVTGVYGKANKIGGKIVYLNEAYVANMMNNNDQNTIPHEIGHTLGLLHPDTEATADDGFWYFWDADQSMDAKEISENPNNAMYSGGSGLLNDKTSTEINEKQIEAGVELYNEGEINLDEN